MIRLRTLGVGFLAAVLSASVVQAQGAVGYRGFQLGVALASVAAQAGVSASEATTVHQRPAILQELEWRRPYTETDGKSADPVQRITFSFYNDQLFRLVIDYDHNRTEGLTDADMVGAISAIYGSPAAPASKANRATAAQIEDGVGSRVAAWGGAEYSAVLYRSSYQSDFNLIVTSVPLSALAHAAELQAIRLDRSEAPQRELARQKKEDEEALVLQQKARVANKAAFRP